MRKYGKIRQTRNFENYQKIKKIAKTMFTHWDTGMGELKAPMP